MEKKEYQLNFNVNISALTEVKNILQDISIQFQELGKQTEKTFSAKCLILQIKLPPSARL